MLCTVACVNTVPGEVFEMHYLVPKMLHNLVPFSPGKSQKKVMYCMYEP